MHDAAPWLYPGSFTARGRWFHNTGVRAGARRADILLTGTEAAANELTAHTKLPADRLRVVPYGVDHPHPEPDPEELLDVLHRYNLVDTRYVLWVGSLEPRKGVGALVAAMARLVARDKSTVLVLAGYTGWQHEKLISADDRAVLGSRLREVGRVRQPELESLYAGATVFAFPSLHEGFGLPVLEAMSAGVPVVASDIPALREVSGDAAVLVPPGDSEAWAEALGSVLDSPARQAELAGAGRRRATNFSWTRTAEATVAIYEELIA